MFNLFPKKKSVDEIIEDTDVTPLWEWKPAQTPSMLQAQNDLIEQFLKENHDLKALLKSIEEDGTVEHNNAIKLREENVKLKLEIKKWEEAWDHQNENIRSLIDQKDELVKEVLGLRHLKEENVQLMERVNEIDSDMNKEYQAEIFTLKNDIAVLKARNAELLKNNNRLTVDYNGVLHNGGLKYMEAKYQILEHNYQGCTKYRDEYKHQLNAANKEIEALKKEKKESFNILKKAIEDESNRFHKLVVEDLNLYNENKNLKTEIKKLKEDIVDYVIEKDDEVNELKKTQDWNKLNKNSVEKRTEKYYVCNHCGYKVAHDTNYWGGCGFCKEGLMIEKEQEIIALKNELQYQLDQNKKLDLQLVALHKIVEGAKTTIDNQKHPMYPIHWGTLDPDIYEQVKDQSIEEVVDALKGMKTQGFEDYDSTDFVKLSYDQSVKIAEMNAVQEKQRKESRDKSWEEAASDLALKVTKLEKQIEELTLKNTNISYSAMNLDGTLKTINCSTTQPYKN
jgi:phage host-nuclease inhibitor protein Gam